MLEYYCPSKTPYNEHDNQCYYHGQEQTCPYCGHITTKCNEGIYKPPKPDHNGYTLREIGG